MRAVRVIAAVAVLSSAVACGGEEETTGLVPEQRQEVIHESPDWGDEGFTTTLATETVAPEQSVTIDAPPYAVEIPEGAFVDDARVELLSTDPQRFSDMLPPDEKPVLAFAFRITDLTTGELVGDFRRPAMLIVTSADLTEGSELYDVGVEGSVSRDIVSPETAPGELRHAIDTADTAYVITSPR